MKHTFLVEIGTEELPPKFLRILAELFAVHFKQQLVHAKLSYDQVIWYASPRRLALKVTNLSAYQDDYEVINKGPSISHAFDALGHPTKAAQAWAIGCGIRIEEAEYLVNNDGKWLFCRKVHKGRAAQLLLVDMVSNALKNLSITKVMRWGDKQDQFIRPVRNLIMLLDNYLIECEILGVRSDRIIYGHRFIGEAKLTIDSAEQYPGILRERGKVIADYVERKSLIKQQANNIAQKLGGIIELPDSLLEEVTSLVEWPVVLSAKFQKKFLLVPIEVIVHIMKVDQKYFPVYDPAGNLMTHFIFVANIDSSDPKQIIVGNEKVIRSRLTDAEFFFKEDSKKRLEEYLPLLEKVVFQKQLGTVRDKTNRLQTLSGWIAKKIGLNINYASRAGLLSKCDLMTNMVIEFADTKGIIGMHYALRDGEVKDVALAIKEQYQPRSSGDQLPTNDIGAVLSLADKIDTLVGIFSINKSLKRDSDPFGLRRAVFGILRIIIEKGYNIDLQELTQQTVQLYGNKINNKYIINNVVDFMLGRLRYLYQYQGYSMEVIQAVLASKTTNPVDFDARIRAVSYFQTLDIFQELATINKRIVNILNKSDDKLLNNHVITSLLKEPEEIALANYLVVLQGKLLPLIYNRQYENVLIELVSLRKVIDVFFKNVIVMDTNQSVRINRLTLLSKLRNLFLQIADISLLQ